MVRKEDEITSLNHRIISLCLNQYRPVDRAADPQVCISKFEMRAKKISTGINNSKGRDYTKRDYCKSAMRMKAMRNGAKECI